MTFLAELASLRMNRQFLFLVDACYSGLALTRGLTVRRPPSSSIGYLMKLARTDSVQIAVAGRSDERAEEDGGNGVFTLAVLRALAGECDEDADEIVTASELSLFARQFVSTRTRNRQTPVFGWIEGEGDVVLRLRAAETPGRLIRTVPQQQEFTRAHIESIKLQAAKLMNKRRAVLAEAKFTQLLLAVGEDDVATGAAALGLANVYANMGRLSASAYYAEMCLRSWHRIHPSDSKGIFAALMLKSTAERGLGESHSALQSLKEALALAEEARWPGSLAMVHNGMAELSLSSGDRAGALYHAHKALRLPEKSRLHTAESFSILGDINRTDGDMEGAAQCYKKGLAVVPQEDTVHRAQLTMKWVKATASASPDTALTTLHAVRGDISRAFGTNSVPFAELKRIEGSVYLATTNITSALSSYAHCIANYRRWAAEDHPDYLSARLEFGNAKRCAGNITGAMAEHEAVLRACNVAGARLAKTQANAHFWLGYDLMANGRYADARQQFSAAASLCESTYGRTHKRTEEAKALVQTANQMRMRRVLSDPGLR